MSNHRILPRSARLAMLGAAVLLGCDGGGTVVPGVGNTVRFASIDAGYYHTCALSAAGDAYCWGGNDFGSLGDGTTVSRQVPTAVLGNLGGLAALDAGAGHNCALTTSGAAYCWGHNDEGQLGDGTFVNRLVAVRVAGTLAFESISAGHAHTCALTAAGEAWCWGDDSQGQLGDGPGTLSRSSLPVRVLHTVPFTAIHAGYYQTCALDAAGVAYCWGANQSGQLGDGTRLPRTAPVVVSGSDFDQLATGDRFVCGRAGDRVRCWGSAADGQLGSAVDSLSTVPVEVTGLSGATSVAAASGASTVPGADAFACATRSGQDAVCWGGAIPSLRTASPAPTTLAAPVRLHAITAGAEHVCGLDSAGNAFCGGANFTGQLGIGSGTDASTLTAVLRPAS